MKIVFLIHKGYVTIFRGGKVLTLAPKVHCNEEEMGNVSDVYAQKNDEMQF